MSSAEDMDGTAARLDNPEASNKKRKVARACDGCRNRKVRCDGPQKKPGEQCSNCATANRDCTYITEAKKRGPPKRYVEGLESKLAKMENLLHKLAPDINIEAELEELMAKSKAEAGTKSSSGKVASRRNSPPTRSTAKVSKERSASTGSLSDLHQIPASISYDTERTAGAAEDCDTSDDELGSQIPTITDALREMTLDPSISRRFHGKSSGLMLVRAAKDLKQQYGGDDSSPPLRREEVWAPSDWEWELWQNYIDPKDVQFPPADLMPRLFDLFFRRLDPFLPVIHRPTFEAQVKDGLHFRCTPFTCVVLLVCAVGSRYCDDPRVCLEDGGPPSAGWKYFIQVKDLKKSLHAPATLADIQVFVLVAYYLQATSAPHSAWTILGIGIRCAQDVGAHRKKAYGNQISLMDEQWKRVFWCLIVLDRNVSSALGRPLACQDEDFDLDFPVEVDDEYWIDDEHGPQQPEGIPPNMSYFNAALRLGQILAFALRTIYTINKSKVLLGFVGPQWEQYIVAELDSAMNKWIDSLPDHLRWDPARENDTHFEQSAMLYSNYYLLRILVHRPFIPSPRKPSALSFPSLAICTNAARSCSHVVDALGQRCEHVQPHPLLAAFTSGIVLLISIWGAKKTGAMMDPNVHLKDVGKCLRFLQQAEADWNSSGRLVDILRELASFGDLPLPEYPPPSTSQKRDRDYDPSSTGTILLDSASPPEDILRSYKPLPKSKTKIPSNDELQQSVVAMSHPTSGPPEVPLTQPYQVPFPESSTQFAQLDSFVPSTLQHLPEQTQTWYDVNPTEFVPLVPPSHMSEGAIGYTMAATEPNAFFPNLETHLGDVPPTSSDAIPLWNRTEPLPQLYPPTDLFGSYIPPPIDTGTQEVPISVGMPVNSHGVLPSNIGVRTDLSVSDAQIFSSESLGIWQGVPRGFEWQDWNDYLASVNPIQPQNL
ncbi:fungal-specific transcription factor domain-containing protein [Cantharellus anzutake]|uniref:fungal-specific transcription factor domain-containing protein n=1 Tax=Cantharellus anzutake TaxID=1750568 RepID=UPI001907483B|nr:fungal-specific transcription factor domain-containing protein [Cantharellus anzutake]KAF8339841.1 fungal-specific transcription factor domain-containing protein [Cantharellus anzutake]